MESISIRLLGIPITPHVLLITSSHIMTHYHLLCSLPLNIAESLNCQYLPLLSRLPINQLIQIVQWLSVGYSILDLIDVMLIIILIIVQSH